MHFHLKSKPKNYFGNGVKFAVLLSTILFFITIFAPNVTTGRMHAVFKPFWYMKDKSIGMTEYLSGFFYFKSSLIKHNADLEEEVNNLRMLKIDYETLLKESSEIKDQFGMDVSYRKIIGNILSKPPQSPYDTFVIDVGTEVGVSTGDLVYLSDSIVVGEVYEVTNKTSIVKLFSSGDGGIEVMSSRTGSNFVMNGNGGANFSFEVPKETDIVWGDTFIYPKGNGAVIANVYFVDTNSQSSFKNVNLRYPVNIFQAKRVFVLKNI